MKRFFIFLNALLLVSGIYAQPAPNSELISLKKIEHTPVKSQGNTGTCWSFSTVSLVESETIREDLGEIDLSEMFVVRNIYFEKARNYLLRQGKAQFGPGGLGNDVINAMDKYGAIPESVYSGLLLGEKAHDHNVLQQKLQTYLDGILKEGKIPPDWQVQFSAILDDHLGKAPETFSYREKTYTPKSFAHEVLKFKKQDYVFVTSFTHHPFYEKFVLEIPDNYGGESYYNIPLSEMMSLTEKAIEKGFSVMWDADVSNKNFKQQKIGYAMMWKDPSAVNDPVNPDETEIPYSAEVRQTLFENLTTQDDHLMHIVGIEKSKLGKKFFLVKNSWGEVGPFKGYIKVSPAYFAINTVTLVVPKDALDAELKNKLGLKN